MFLKIFKEYTKSKKTAYLIFPEHEPKINHYGLLYLDEFLLRSDYNKAVIITSDKGVLDSACEFSDNISDAVNISDKEISHIIDYYSMIPFSDDVRVLSLDMPAGRRGSNLLGKNDLSLEQIVAIGIYHLIPFEQLSSQKRWGGV